MRPHRAFDDDSDSDDGDAFVRGDEVNPLFGVRPEPPVILARAAGGVPAVTGGVPLPFAFYGKVADTNMYFERPLPAWAQRTSSGTFVLGYSTAGRVSAEYNYAAAQGITRDMCADQLVWLGGGKGQPAAMLLPAHFEVVVQGEVLNEFARPDELNGLVVHAINFKKAIEVGCINTTPNGHAWTHCGFVRATGINGAPTWRILGGAWNASGQVVLSVVKN